MVEEVELSTIDLRYESYRLKSAEFERRLLASILERGIEEPLEGVDVGGRRILLNGFKRYRCAVKLGLSVVPYSSLGEDVPGGIIALLRVSNEKTLSILEQARFVAELKDSGKLAVGEIAETLSRSKAWVTLRLGLLKDMSPKVREALFSGAFPVYSYMYLRRFMRINGGDGDVEAFVSAVAGKKLSVREIELLARGYFQGPEWFRREVQEGKLTLVLERMKRVPDAPDGTNDFERRLLGDLEMVAKYMSKTTAKSLDPKIETRAFCAQANLVLAGILSRLGAFTQAMRTLYDRTGEAEIPLRSVQGRNEQAEDRFAVWGEQGDAGQDRARRRRGPGAEVEAEDPARPRASPETL